MRNTIVLFLFLAFSFGGCSCMAFDASPRDRPPQDDQDDGKNPFHNPTHPPTDVGEPRDGSDGCTYELRGFDNYVLVCPPDDEMSCVGDDGDDYLAICYYPDDGGAPYGVHVKRCDIDDDPAYGECPMNGFDGGIAGSGGNAGYGGAAGDNGSAGTDGTSGSGGSGGPGGDGGDGGSAGAGGNGGSAGDNGSGGSGAGSGGNSGDGGEPPWCGHPHPKVEICHYPDGDPDKAHTLHVPESAVRAHIANHGDHLGPCENGK